MKHIIKTSVVLLFVLAAAVATYAQSAIGTVVTLSGYILNGNTLSPVESGYSLYDATGKKVGQSNRSNANDGYLVTGLKPGQTYTIKIEDPRYFKQEFKSTFLRQASTSRFRRTSLHVRWKADVASLFNQFRLI